MDIPALPLANFANKIIKILSGEDSPLIPLALKNQLQTGKILQGEIIKLLPKGKSTVSIAGQKVVAELSSLKTQNDSATVKPEYSFKPGQKIYARVEKVNPEPILKLVPQPQQKVQEEGYTTNLSRRIKPEILKSEKFSELKLPPDRIIQINVNSVVDANILKEGYTINLSRRIKPEILKSEKFSELKLPPDRIVQVNVNRVIDANTLSVQFEDQEFLVKTENAKLYRQDTAIRIQFEKTDSGFKSILLDQPVKPATVDLELIKPYLAFRTPLGKLVGELTRDILGSPVLKELQIQPQLLEKLQETLQVLTPKPGITPDEIKIEEQVEKSGVRYEAKVKQFLTKAEDPKVRLELARDLKGQLLDLLQVTEKSIKNLSDQNQSRQVSDFQQRIKVSVDSIELNQLSLRVATQENQPLVLQIPNPLSPGDKTINLFIREDTEGRQDGKKDNKEVYNMAFFLNLSALGNIKINAKVGPESLAVRIDVEKSDVADFIRNNSSEFEQRMEKKDLNTTVECCTREKISPIKDNLIELLVSKNTSLLSVKI